MLTEKKNALVNKFIRNNWNINLKFPLEKKHYWYYILFPLYHNIISQKNFSVRIVDFNIETNWILKQEFIIALFDAHRIYYSPENSFNLTNYHNKFWKILENHWYMCHSMTNLSKCTFVCHPLLSLLWSHVFLKSYCWKFELKKLTIKNEFFLLILYKNNKIKSIEFIRIHKTKPNLYYRYKMKIF